MASRRRRGTTAGTVPLHEEIGGEIAPTAVVPAPVPIRERKTDNDVPEDERELVGKLLGRIQRALDLNNKFHTVTLPRLRRLLWGTSTVNVNDQDQSVRANLIFSTVATMLPHVYAKNPEIAITPTEAAHGSEYEKWKQFCHTAQAFLNRMLIEEGGLKRRAKANVRSAMGTSLGWMKMVFQEREMTDPLMIKRQSDMQDDLSRLEALIERADDDTRGQLESDREEIRQRMAAMEQSKEVRMFKGFNIDRVQTEDILVLDESVIEFDNYVDADMIAHRVWMTDDDYERQFGGKPLPGAKTFGQPGASEATDESGQKITFSDGAGGNTKYRAVFEVWDKTANRVYTVALGQAGYCCEPFTPDASPQRWYSFYGLAFNQVEGRFRPLSDTELIEHLQAEYSETRYLYAEARKEAIPTRVFRKGGELTEDDITKLATRKARQWIGIDGNPQLPIAQEFLQLPGIAIDPAAYDVTLIRNDIDMMVGLSDASRANLIQAKTATEAEIMRQALMNRVAERQDTNEDMISDMARAALEIALQKFTKAEVAEVVGEKAVWIEDFPVIDEEPTQAAMAEWQRLVTINAQSGLEPPPQPAPVTKPMSMEAIFHRIGAAVRAGSTGRPNQMKEREQWTQLMPVIGETATKVAELRAQGAFDLAETQVALLRETLRRFDERLDIDTLIPPQEMDESGQPTGQGQQMREMQQKLAQMEQLTEELEACKQELESAQQALQQAKAQEQAKIAEADAKREMEVERERTRQAEIDAKRVVDEESARLADERARDEHEDKMALELQKTLVSTAGSVYVALAKPVAPKAGPDGEVSTAQVPEPPSFAEILDQLTGSMGAPTKPRRPAADDGDAAPPEPSLAEVMSTFMEGTQQMIAALVEAQTADREVVLGPNGLPQRLRVVPRTVQ